MANDQAHDTRTTVAEDRVAAAVSLNVAGVAGSSGSGPGAPGVLPAMEVANYFTDGFESADLNRQRPGGGDFWVANQYGSVVTQTQGTTPGQPTVVYNGSAVNIGVSDSKDWTATEGDYCLRVRYNAGQSDNATQHWKIQEADAMPEIYMGFKLRVPVNFKKSGSNNKLIVLWMDGRGNRGNGSTTSMEFRGTDDANWYVKVGEGDQVLGGDQGYAPWISYPEDQGRWMTIVFYSKAESSPGASDGVVKAWRAWEGDSEFEFTHNITGQPIKLPDNPSDPQGFCECEMLGYPNGAYAEDTEFLMDDVRISSTPLVPAGTEGL